jgi:hypothetical protein
MLKKCYNGKQVEIGDSSDIINNKDKSNKEKIEIV